MKYVANSVSRLDIEFFTKQKGGANYIGFVFEEIVCRDRTKTKLSAQKGKKEISC